MNELLLTPWQLDVALDKARLSFIEEIVNTKQTLQENNIPNQIMYHLFPYDISYFKTYDSFYKNLESLTSNRKVEYDLVTNPTFQANVLSFDEKTFSAYEGYSFDDIAWKTNAHFNPKGYQILSSVIYVSLLEKDSLIFQPRSYTLDEDD